MYRVWPEGWRGDLEQDNRLHFERQSIFPTATCLFPDRIVLLISILKKVGPTRMQWW